MLCNVMMGCAVVGCALPCYALLCCAVLYIEVLYCDVVWCGVVCCIHIPYFTLYCIIVIIIAIATDILIIIGTLLL